MRTTPLSFTASRIDFSADIAMPDKKHSAKSAAKTAKLSFFMP
jgi:hypothetical protein